MFIALEGIDGSGKTTQAQMLAQYFEQHKKSVHLTAEPTKGVLGKIIREAFNRKITLAEEAIAALFAADRLQHIHEPEQGILSLLNKNITVVTDRYYFSSYAYHSVHVNMDWVIQCNAQAANALKPTATIFIDVSPKVAMQRIAENRQSTELYETLDNLTKVRDNYFTAFDKLKSTEKIIIINGEQSLEAVHQAVVQAVSSLQ